MAQHDRIETAYLREGPRLLSWLRSRVGPEAEDLLHDLLARALADLDSLEPVRDLAAWLWRGARNAVIDAWRSRERRRAVEGLAEDRAGGLEDLVDETWRNAYDEVEEEELLEALDAAIEELPPEQREVILAQALGGETFAAMAGRTGTPPETLAARKRYALAKIRDALRDFREE